MDEGEGKGNRRTFPFQETICFLTTQAFYTSRFNPDDYQQQMVLVHRISLSDIISLRYGVYITSTLTPPLSIDERRNVGILIRYLFPPSEKHDDEGREGGNDGQVKILALKYFPTVSSICSSSSNDDNGDNDDGNNSVVTVDTDPLQQVAKICQTIIDQANLIRPPDVDDNNNNNNNKEDEEEMVNHQGGTEKTKTKTKKLKKRDPIRLEATREIFSLQDAHRSTGLVQRWSFSLRRYIWAS